TDSATDDQIRRYREYAAGRFDRTTSPQGARGMLFSPDYVGTSDELADQLFAHAGFRRADEVAFALPFTFDAVDYEQIVTDLAEKLGPKLGWTPGSAR
ncbi:MAG: LLM class flavin-dependent oxidoreductase, partial [Marmoricola sp.]